MVVNDLDIIGVAVDEQAHEEAGTFQNHLSEPGAASSGRPSQVDAKE
jgi:hypothetical protein